MANWLLPVGAVLAFDAVSFTLAKRRRLAGSGAVLAVIDAYLAKDPIGSDCEPGAGCINSIDATCSKLQCAAKKLKCTGDGYDSGECKDIKELHEAANCEFAKDSCGKKLPEIFDPRCGHWWEYRCRIAALLNARRSVFEYV